MVRVPWYHSVAARHYRQHRPPPPEMPHEVFKIDEVLRLIAGHVVDLCGPGAIAFACCCKTFEEPVLSFYWEDRRLDKLASVLPEGVLKRSGLGVSPHYVRTSGKPPTITSADVPRRA